MLGSENSIYLYWALGRDSISFQQLNAVNAPINVRVPVLYLTPISLLLAIAYSLLLGSMCERTTRLVRSVGVSLRKLHDVTMQHIKNAVSSRWKNVSASVYRFCIRNSLFGVRANKQTNASLEFHIV